MAVQKATTNATPLRVISHTLSRAELSELPKLAVDLAYHIRNCGEALQSCPESISRSHVDSGVSVIVHHFKTEISSFVQDRSSEKQFAAIVLIKASIEAAGLRAFQKDLPLWIRQLLSILKV